MEQWWLLLETEFAALNPDLQRFLYDSFRRFAYKELFFLLKDHALIEDVIQESFLKATSKRQQIKQYASAKQWMKRVIRNTALDTLKRTGKYRHTVGLENVSNTDADHRFSVQAAASVADTVETGLRNQMLHEAILELKYEYRILLWMYYIEEKPLKVIAQECGVSEQAMAQRLARARKKLLLQFSRKWVDHDDG